MIPSRYTSKLCGAGFLVLLVIAWGCRSGEQKSSESSPLNLTLAVSSFPASALIAIAHEKGYFLEEKLAVTIDLYTSGREALEAVGAGKAQVATVADIAFATKVLTEPSLRVLASIGTTVGSRIVARKDRGIALPADLKGKKIGYSAGTVSDYFLYTFLVAENISFKDFQAVNIPPSRQAEALVTGEVDAVSAFENYAFEASNRLGENTVSWQSQNNLAYHWLLAAKKEVTRSPEPLERLLRALIKAEDAARGDMAETTRIIARRWNYEPAFLNEFWQRSRLTVSFGQSIVTSLQNYIEWQALKGTTPAATDILDYLDPRILDRVAPERIAIFH